MTEEELVIHIPSSSYEHKRTNIVRVIFTQITSGVGLWGSFKPVLAVLLSLVPFLFLGQHFNRRHRKGMDLTLLQLPLLLTGILWVILFLWSIFDAWNEAQNTVISAHNARPA